jgi:SAM-dependent methyltransferase
MANRENAASKLNRSDAHLPCGNVADLIAATDQFYQVNASEYFQRTVSADMTHLYDRFLPHVPPGARILDAGCGSGRDLRVFRDRGYRAIGVDAAPALVEIARSYSGVPCFVGRLEDLVYNQSFDAIWACASLLHIPKMMLARVLDRFWQALVPDGLLYASVQDGSGEHIAPDGRFYAYYQCAEFLESLASADFRVQEAWRTDDALADRDAVNWINVIAHSAARLPNLGT